MINLKVLRKSPRSPRNGVQVLARQPAAPSVVRLLIIVEIVLLKQVLYLSSFQLKLIWIASSNSKLSNSPSSNQDESNRTRQRIFRRSRPSIVARTHRTSSCSAPARRQQVSSRSQSIRSRYPSKSPRPISIVEGQVSRYQVYCTIKCTTKSLVPGGTLVLDRKPTIFENSTFDSWHHFNVNFEI